MIPRRLRIVNDHTEPVLVLSIPTLGVFYWWVDEAEVRFYRKGKSRAVAIWQLFPSRNSIEGALFLISRQIPFLIDGDIRF